MSAITAPRPRPRALPIAAVVAVSVANLFVHKPISDVCDALFARVGRRWYEIISLAAISALCVLAALPALRRLGAALAATWLPAALLGLAVLTAAAQRWLLVTNIELIHFPQFALIAALFAAAGVGPRAAFALGTLAGVLDETYQHLVLYAGVPNTYFDINDILLNAIGAAWGVCLFAAAELAAAGPLWPRLRPYGMAALAAAGAVALALVVDPPDDTLLRPAATRRMYRVLSLGEGLVGIAAVVALVELGSVRRGRGGR